MSKCIKLKFNENETYSIKIENIEEMNSSIFLKTYISAYKNLNGLLKKDKNYNFDTNKNNIIAFLGERGVGKTSCMQSFLNSILELYKANSLKDETDLKKEMLETEKIGERFEKIDIIEPSFFSEKVNIIELVVSSMFKKFNESIKENSQNYDDKKKLLKKFQEIYKAMKYMECSEQYKNSEIEELLYLGTAIDFKENLKELIDMYLRFWDKSKFIITIDDIDLNTDYAYEMVEDIRKYLSVENTVVLIALKLEQLKNVILKKYLLEYTNLVNLENYNDYICKDINNRVEKYLLKLIPQERRMYIKHLDEYINNDFEVVIAGQQIKSKDEKLQSILLEFLHQKTGLIFLPTRIGMNKIIPTNFRELIGFFAILSKIEDIRKGENQEKVKEINYRIFKEYFFNFWIKNKLASDEEQIVNIFLKQDYENKNKYISEELATFKARTKNATLSLSSIGEVAKLLTTNLDELYFVTKILYSFELYETYKTNKNAFAELVREGYIEESDLKEIDQVKLVGLLKSDEKSKVEIGKFLLFFVKEKKNNKAGKYQEKKYEFSVFAPMVKGLDIKKTFSEFDIIYNDELDKKFKDMFENLNYRNMDIIEEFQKIMPKNIIFDKEKIYDLISSIYNGEFKEFNKGLFIKIEEVDNSLENINNFLEEMKDLKKEFNILREEEENIEVNKRS